MLNLDFNNIRSIGSINDGFEEMVCQLAHRMIVPNGKRFVRNGRPDGGVECYWELENGEVWMWQAKYFPSSPGAAQFAQIDKSVKTALALHKNVKRYYVSLPLDLPDDGKAKTKSARKRYDEKVTQWQKIKGAEDTEFIYWGKHELLNILSKKENEGLVHFWFNKEEFTDEDFDKQNKKAIDELGARYTPELNVKLEISNVFDGLSRNDQFVECVKEYLTKYKIAWGKIDPSEEDQQSKEYLELKNEVTDIIKKCGEIIYDGVEKIPFVNLIEGIKKTSVLSQAFFDYYQNKEKAQTEYTEKGTKKVDFSYIKRKISEFNFEANDLVDFLNSPQCQAANLPYIVVSGEAGVGKSHLFADEIENRRRNGRYSLFFLGQDFNATDDPWTQIFKQLKFKGTETEFLEALEAKAETTGQRIVIFVDALNEGGGKVLWHKHLTSLIKQIKEYPWIGLVLSIRTTYTKVILGDDIMDGVLYVSHRGFEKESFDAIKLYFRNSNITLPSVPLLLPEFKNPLFLKLFCDGLHRNGLTKVEEGMQGITSVLKLFIDGVEKDLSAPDKRNYLPELRLVKKSVNKLIDYQVEHQTTEVPLDVAIELTDSVKTDSFRNGELLYELVSYGVLTRNMSYRRNNEYEEVVYLSYERFNDFLTAQRLLEKEGDTKTAIKQFIKEESDLWYYAGLLESFAIIIPEKTGKELYEILPEYRDSDCVVDGVMKSLLWRKKSTIEKKLVDYFNEVMTEQRSTNFMSILIQLGSSVNHYFNAEFLHRNLMGWTMADRDYTWSMSLRDISGDRYNSVETLITWAKEEFGEIEIDADSKYLIGIVLGWFTTCMDRRIRDNASKGLINLVRDDIDLMIKLIEKFDGVNDPYVMERIYAAAYGCALLSKDAEKLPNLAQCVYRHIFDVEGEVYPDALVRDYAKGVIEYALSKNPDIKMGSKPYTPPYKSSFVEVFPSDEEIKSYSKKDKDGKWLTPGIDYILESMVTEHGYSVYGDFGRYIFQSHLSGWQIDPQKLSNLAVKWIIEKYGYKEKLFGVYDKTIGYGRMRQVYPGERIGKKYQWIALNEMVARLSDNYPVHDSWSNKTTKYDGTWNPYIRDFDPTMLMRKSIPAWYDEESRYWWNSIDYNEWCEEKSGWARRFDSLPNPAKVIETVDDNGIHWLALQAMPDWVEPHEKDTGVYCNLWYQIRSYIIDEDKFDSFKSWAVMQDFSGRWMPEVSDRYEMFSREYYWSSAYRYYEEEGIISREIYDKKYRRKIADVELPCVGFLWESEFDYSKPNTVAYLKPSKQLFEGMKMKYSDIDGELVDDNGKLLCFDTRVSHNSHGYLLVRKNEFLQYLSSHRKRIIWALIGEKNLLGSFIPHSDWLEMSGCYYLDEQGKVKGNMKVFLEGKKLSKTTKS